MFISKKEAEIHSKASNFISNILRAFKPTRLMDQLADDLARKLGVARNTPSLSSQPSPDLDSKDSLGKTQTEQKLQLPIENHSPEAAAVSAESQDSSGQDQTPTTTETLIHALSNTAIANNLDVTSPPKAMPPKDEIAPTPAVRYFTHRNETVKEQDQPAFGWFVTSPEGHTTWMYIA
ncbi:hypothetical protein FQN54_007901 [Arachnomyces sp. PD_36]|nr:hypothetical protein FQN54_007901 [Arachnomyces sp. PD_36]